MTRRPTEGVGELVNLRRARKRQASAKAEIEAAANRFAFGVSKRERNRVEAERTVAENRLEAHRRLRRCDDD
jgi:hypothetical protein